jgi:excisionase family DNA binding protein
VQPKQRPNPQEDFSKNLRVDIGDGPSLSGFIRHGPSTSVTSFGFAVGRRPCFSLALIFERVTIARMIHRNTQTEQIRYLLPFEAAKFLRISERTLWTLTKRGEIPCSRVGVSKRYSVDALERFMARGGSAKDGRR